MIFSVPLQLWIKVVGSAFVIFGVPSFLLVRWLKKHPESSIRTWLNILSAIVVGGAAIARFHSWIVAVMCLFVGACLYADLRKRQGKDLFAGEQ